MSEMTSGLVERIEAATGPDRAIDMDIFCAIGLAQFVEGAFDAYRAPAYTASIDAAMTLVPKGRFVGTLGQCDIDGEWYARIEAHHAVYEDATGPTPALALCAAALRARAPLPAPPAKDTI